MLTTSKLIEKLKTNFFLKKAQEEAARLGELRSQIKEVPEGEIIYQTGERAGFVYLILYGLVKIKIKTKQGAKIINKAAGDFFGEREVLEGLERNSTAIAEIGTELLPVPASLFTGLVYSNKEIKTNVKINLARTYDLTKEGAEAILDEGEPEKADQLLSSYVGKAEEVEEIEEVEEEATTAAIEEPVPPAPEEIEEHVVESEVPATEPEFTYSIPDDEEEEYEEEDMYPEEPAEEYAVAQQDIDLIEASTGAGVEDADIRHDIDIVEAHFAGEEEFLPADDRWDEEEEEFRDFIESDEEETEEEPDADVEHDLEIIEDHFATEDEPSTPPQADHPPSPTPDPSVLPLIKLLVSVCRAESPDDIYNSLKYELPAMVGAREFVMFNFDGGFLTPAGGYQQGETNFAVREKIAYELIMMKEPVTLFDLDGSGMIEGLEHVDARDIPSSLLYYPLTDSADRVIGCFIFFSSVSGRFSPGDVMMLEYLAKAASGVLDKVTAGRTSLTAKYEDLQKYTAFFGSEIKMAVETILSVSETLDRGKLSDKVRFGFDIIRERASGLKGFLDSIQFFVGKIPGFTKQPYLVSELLDDFLVKVSEPAKQREVTLLRKYQADMVMFFNRELFIHALTLVTQNSFDAMPEGGKIYYSTSANESNILISIRDTGPGVHADMRDKIFEPFFTFGKTGVGLGLPIANKIIKEHGGYIYLESSRNQGTEIIIALPV